MIPEKYINLVGYAKDLSHAKIMISRFWWLLHSHNCPVWTIYDHIRPHRVFTLDLIKFRVM